MKKYSIEIAVVAVFVAASVLLVWMYSGLPGKNKQLTPFPEEVTPPPVVNYLYDIPSDSFIIGGGTVRTNQIMSGLLSELGVSLNDINRLMEETTAVFDVRKFKAGNKYVTLSSSDSIKKLKYFIYEKDPVHYLVLSLDSIPGVWNGEKNIDTLQSTFAGSVHSSLWNTFADNGANPMMANELSEIYAWTIDFFGLQKGDSMRVVYDELFVDSISIGIGKIHGAWFRHMNKDFWAIPFMQDSVYSYFDEEGQSLRKAFLKAPLRFSRISSRFSNSRLHPVLKIRRPHHGVDYAAPVGTPVYSIGDGVVTQTSYDKGAGNMVKIKHNSVYSTAYLHLSKFGSGVRQGAYVKQGEVIGYVGSTGLSTGPHLDFRFYKNGSAIDPLKVEAPPVDPVKENNLADFEVVKSSVMKKLSGF